MKNKIRSLLGIEMSLNGYEFKPIMLLLGILMFIGLCVPLLLIYSFYYVKFTLYNSWNTILKNNKVNRDKGLKGV